MKIPWVVALLVPLVLAGCSNLSDSAVPDDLTPAAAPATTGVFWLTDETQVENAYSTLVRSDNSIEMTIHTSELSGGHAITIWWVIFNNPGACTGGICNEDDVLPPGTNPDAAVGVHYAAGHVIGGDGKGSFAGILQVGDGSGAIFGEPLLDPLAAEVHLIVRTHGPPLPGEVVEQIRTFGGGCSEATGGGEGAEGFPCEDLQFAVHQP